MSASTDIRYGEVGIAAFQHRGQPLTLQIDIPVPDALQLLIDAPQCSPPLFVPGPAPELESAPVPLYAANLREA